MDTQRRGFPPLAAAAGALDGTPGFAESPTLAAADAARNQLWWLAPGSPNSMIEQGLPIGNGRLGALASNNPASEHLTITDATLWTGGLNDTLQSDGQFPYGRADFGSLSLLGSLTVEIPDHDLGVVDNYRRWLDMAQGLVGAVYEVDGVTYRRQIFASRPDDVIVLYFAQQGSGAYTGRISLAGAHGEATTASATERYVADFRPLFERFRIDLGPSSAAQRELDTWERLQARHRDNLPDPEFEAAYLQFGRYLMIAGSRDSLPMGLQGPWLDGNDPDWMGDYHTDVNIQMNYWLADRAGLPDCFDALTHYCLAQLSSWTEVTRRLFNTPTNRYRNSTGKIAGWTVAISTNPYGGGGWWWHPAGNAWLCQNLFEHYEYTQDRTYLAKIYPLLKGAVEFWEARLVPTTVTDAAGATREVLIADSDWSAEHGPLDAKGITYAQELVWNLFVNYRTATRVLGRDTGYAATVDGLRARLYLPVVSPETGWLQEWMSPANLGETTHRHLSPLIGLFPGDRIRPDGSTPDDILAGAAALLAARGMNSFGWANAWRALCWARLKDAEKAYQLVVNNLKPSVDGSNGSAPTLFDIYEAEQGRGIFQIDANLGTPAAVVEMLVYSRPGHVELLPALPAAWAASGSVAGVGVRGGFVVDLTWRDGKPTQATFKSVGGCETTVVAGGTTQQVNLRPGASVTLRYPGS